MAIFDEVDTILLGRTTYEGLRQFWPTQTDPYAERINKTPKIVIAHSGLKEVSWGDWDTVSLINKDVENRVRELKQGPGKDMVIFASSKLVQTFADADLIDEYRITVHPIILGSGKYLFANIKNRRLLKSLGTKQYKSGALFVRYEVSRP